MGDDFLSIKYNYYQFYIYLYIFITFINISFIHSQNSVEKTCIKKNQYAYKTDVQPSDCTSVHSSCCYVHILYQFPDFEVEDKYCFVNYIDIDTYVKGLKETLYTDILRYVRKSYNDYYKLEYIEYNSSANYKKQKKYWCPIDCSSLNMITLTCDEEVNEETVLDIKAKEVGDLFIQEHNLPENNLNNCKSISVDSKCLEGTTEYNNEYKGENPFKDLEDSLNLQYGFTGCYDAPCNSTEIESVKNAESLFIGNKNLDINPKGVRPDSCTTFPSFKDILTLTVECGSNYKPKA